MSKKKAAGTTKNNRDSESKRLGVKKFGGEVISKGQVILRQRGTKFHAGVGVGRGGDDTLFALEDGFVNFSKKKVLAFTGNLTKRSFVNVVSN